LIDCSGGSDQFSTGRLTCAELASKHCEFQVSGNLIGVSLKHLETLAFSMQATA